VIDQNYNWTAISISGKFKLVIRRPIHRWKRRSARVLSRCYEADRHGWKKYP